LTFPRNDNKACGRELLGLTVCVLFH